MILQGPVSSAARAGTLSPWFGIGVGVFVLATLWIRYFTNRNETEAALSVLLGITAICLLFILTGVWRLMH
jgi:hypothetical protein